MQASSPEILVLKGLGLSFGSETALAPLDLSLAEGEQLSLLGRSGTGKTSLLSLVAGLREPSSGSLTRGFRADDLGFVFQDHRLLPWKSLRENILLGARSPDAKDELGDLAERIGLGPHLDKFPSRVSGGQKQRAALARAFLRHPRILLLDEPFSSLDEQTRESLQDELLLLLSLRPCAMILVTHNLEEALYCSPRVMVLGRRGWLGKVDHPHSGQRSEDARLALAASAIELRRLLAVEAS